MISPGTLLQNRYRVAQQIGQGGMGTVYVATDERFRSTVALKETHFDEPGLRRAFEREAHLLHRLRHAALPKVTDHFAEGPGQFLVMEFIPGEDLSEMLRARAGAFDLKDVLSWADQLLDALDYLHTQDTPVVHRDIKPQNLKLASRNQIVLLDFGLAKGSAAQLTRVTATGSVFGYSRHYAPLEQIQGAGTDPRSDLYSLGATLYHLLTAAPPPDALTRATAVLNGQPDPLAPASEVNSRVPASVSDVLARAMSLSAGQRPQTASEMRDALRAAAALQDSAPEPLSSQSAPAQTANTVYEQGALFNQQTRLMNPSADPTGAPADPFATRRADASDAATVAGDSAPTNKQQPDSAAPPTARADDHATRAASAPTSAPAHNAPPANVAATNVGASGASAAPVERGESVLTEVRAPRAVAASPRRTGRVVVAAAAAVFLTVAGTAALYNFTRDNTQTNTPARVAPPTNAPAAVLPPAATQPSPAAPSPATADTPAAPQQQTEAVTSPAARPAASAARTQPNAPAPSREPSSEPRAGSREQAAPDAPDAELDGVVPPRRPGVPPSLTPEERRRLREALRDAPPARRRAIRRRLRQEMLRGDQLPDSAPPRR